MPKIVPADPPGGSNEDYAKAYPKRASNDTNPKKGEMGPDSRTDPSPTDEIEEWQQRQHNSPDAPLDRSNDKGVDPVLGWPNQTRLT